MTTHSMFRMISRPRRKRGGEGVRRRGRGILDGPLYTNTHYLEKDHQKCRHMELAGVENAEQLMD